MTRTERIITIIAAVITILVTLAGVIGWVKSKPFSPWAYSLLAFFAGLLIGYILGRLRLPWLSTGNPSIRKIDSVSFDYLPDSPLNHGWKLGLETDDAQKPDMFVANDAPSDSALRVKFNGKYKLEYFINQTVALSNMVEFYIRFEDTSAFYLLVSLTSKDGSKKSEGWLCYKPDDGKPQKKFAKEWSLPIGGEVMKGGWIAARLAIADDVKKTHGTEGWIYAGMKRIRLRGSLAISGLEFLRIENPNK